MIIEGVDPTSSSSATKIVDDLRDEDGEGYYDGIDEKDHASMLSRPPDRLRRT
jgi:hypothetical protein